MGAWILGITGVVCLGVLIEILLPDGQAGKYLVLLRNFYLYLPESLFIEF